MASATDGAADRAYWVATLERMALPVLEALATRTLKQTMPCEGAGDDRYGPGGRAQFTHLEAFGRTLVGIAPYLDCPGLSGAEEAARARMAQLARAAIDAATDPASADYVNWDTSFQPIVDAAFLCHALLRAPQALVAQLEPRVRDNLVAALKATRSRKPHWNNWLLFSAMIECGIRALGDGGWDKMRVDYALRQHEQWYRGDGIYGDGKDVHNDYYNSFVIQPFLVDIITAVGEEYPEWADLRTNIYRRAVRYGEVLERMVSETGTFPPLGRSIAYRCGALQHLAQMALQGRLGEHVVPEQVRCALTAVIRRSLEAPGTYTADGKWLRVGFAGHQPECGEMYISTGSLYLASTAFLPLGLPPTHRFWAGPATDWTAKRMWAGGFAPMDHALDHKLI